MRIINKISADNLESTAWDSEFFFTGNYVYREVPHLLTRMFGHRICGRVVVVGSCNICCLSIKSIVGQQMRQAGSRRPNRRPRAHCSRSQRTYENAPSLIVPIIE